MFENSKIEKAKQKDLANEFREKEQDIIQSGIKTFEKASPQDIRKKAGFRATAAFLTFLTGAGIADQTYAQEKSTEKVSPEIKNENVFQPRQDLLFDWEKLVDKIDVSYNREDQSLKEFKGEFIRWNNFSDKKIISSKFYEGLSSDEYVDAKQTVGQLIKDSKNSSDFFASLSESQEKLSQQEKLLLLQEMGSWAGATYNYDMLKQNQKVEVSDKKMFESIKLYYETGRIDPSGICGNIHTFLAKIAQELGFEAWLQNGLVEYEKPISHIWTGLIAEDAAGKKQIVFLDYNTLIPTGTLNYSEALGIFERHRKQISTFNSYVGATDKVLFPVKSLAQQKIESASGFKGSENILSERLEMGKIARERGLDIKLSNETKEIKFSKDSLALAYLNYQDSGNPYQSINDLNAMRASLRLGKEKFGVELDTTFLNLNIKDLENGILAQNEIINRLNLDFINSHQFNKDKYERFILSYGLSLEGGARYILGKSVKPFGFAAGEAEGSAGVRLTYFDPNNIGKFFIETTDSLRLQKNDFQNQDLILKQAAVKLKVGGTFKAREGIILNLESAIAKTETGKTYEAELGIETSKIKGKIGAVVSDSEFERFVPSSEKISAEIGYKVGDQPKAEIIIFGSQLKEKYKGETADHYEIGIKMRIFLW